MDGRYQYPSVTVSRKIRGDDLDYAAQFNGEANKLLYELKNLMKFRKLGQLKMTRPFQDGTVITAYSVFGLDFITIDVERAVPSIRIEEQCTVTLLNLPDIVQPMRYPGQIRTDEIAGTDYIKTYYIADVARCRTCTTIAGSIVFEFIDATVQSVPGEPDNHCIYSIAPPCWGQVIDQGFDEVGTYFRWKVFTETDEYSRTGKGYFRLKIYIDSGSVKELCQGQTVITADCCRKSLTTRQTLMYWQKCDALSDWCPVPEDEQPSGVLTFFGFADKEIPLATFPENIGSCPPYAWENKGVGTLTVEPNTLSAKLKLEGPQNCQGKIGVKVIDRCGTEDELRVESCCEGASYPLVISYTSLQMQCSDSQNLSVSGGCPPYRWDLSGGGTLSPAEGSWISYWSPSSNVDCALNPTITVTDCCGASASIKIAVNCYTGDAMAFRYCDMKICEHACTKTTPPGFCHFHAVQGVWRYRCNGTLWTSQFQNYPGHGVATYDCYDSADYNWGCAKNTGGCENCGNEPAYACASECEGCICPQWVECLNQACGTDEDQRTSDMKAQGCCPLNPWTGLPY